VPQRGPEVLRPLQAEALQLRQVALLEQLVVRRRFVEALLWCVFIMVGEGVLRVGWGMVG